MNYTQYIKPALLALIPFLIGFGEVIKRWLFGGQEAAVGQEATLKVSALQTFVSKLIPTKKQLPYLIWALAFILSSAYGLITSIYTGWRLVVDAVILTGLVQGSIVGFASMGVFDTLKKKEN